jgi:mRNA interferase MazF
LAGITNGRQMRRSDIYRVNWEPSTKGEPAFSRPAVILTNNEANERLPHLVVAPVTTSVDRLYPFDVLLPVGCCGLKETSKVQLNYVRGLNRSRLGDYLGLVSAELMLELDEKLRIHLGF